MFAVRFRAQLGNGQWRMKSLTGRYLGTSWGGKQLDFDLRPLAGTTGVHPKNIMQILGPMPSTTRPRLPHDTTSSYPYKDVTP